MASTEVLSLIQKIGVPDSALIKAADEHLENGGGKASLAGQPRRRGRPPGSRSRAAKTGVEQMASAQAD